MIAKLLLQNSFFVVGMGVLLFASAGTLHWPAAWVYPGHLGDTRPGLRIMARQNRSGAARRTDAADGPQRAAGGRQEIHAGVRRRGVLVVCRDRAGPAHACVRRPRGAAGAGPCHVPALDRLHHVGVSRKFLCRRPWSRCRPNATITWSRLVPTRWCAIPCTAASCCSSSARRCCWDRGGGSRWRRCSSCCSPFASRIEERALIAGLPDYADYAAHVRYRLVPGLW